MLQISEVGLGDMCVKWFSTGRRARKEMDWGRLYNRILKLLMPDLDLAQLMVSTDDYQECMQLYLSSLVYLYLLPIFREKKTDVVFVENLSNDLLVLIKGTIRLEGRD